MLNNDANIETLIFAVNRLTDVVEKLDSRLAEAVDDRNLQIAGLRERVVKLETERPNAVTRGEMLKWIGGIVGTVTAGLIIYIATTGGI